MKFLKTTILTFICICSLSEYVASQKDSSNFLNFMNKLQANTGKGNITINQDSSVELLILKHIYLNTNDINLNGWRIQIYTSSGKEAREVANEERNKFMNTYSNVKAYLIYQPPFFKIRIGDFRTKQEAFTLYKTLLATYPTSYLVQEKINLTPID